MDWLKKLLEGLGLSGDAVTSIVDGVTKNYEGYVPKHRFDEVNTAKKQLEKDLKDRDDQLTELQKSAGDNQTLKDQITKLQEENKAAADKYAADVADLKLSTALKTALHGKVHDPDIVATLLDKTKIEIAEDGSIKAGFDDQLKSLQESKAFLFVPEETAPTFTGMKPAEGSKGGGGGKPDPAANYGAQLAAKNKQQQGSDAVAKATEHYFG
ncbi:phage scaffolding protein [Paenibacillus shunpengii]|uniref:Phage scaffolding protein n=1 Tax=Paenibacillus shunpengii TaxID=2054424 RepID=A0ABW5SY65_9BACL